jgi:hypothetical protein
MLIATITPEVISLVTSSVSRPALAKALAAERDADKAELAHLAKPHVRGQGGINWKHAATVSDRHAHMAVIATWAVTGNTPPPDISRVSGASEFLDVVRGRLGTECFATVIPAIETSQAKALRRIAEIDEILARDATGADESEWKRRMLADHAEFARRQATIVAGRVRSPEEIAFEGAKATRLAERNKAVVDEQWVAMRPPKTWDSRFLEAAKLVAEKAGHIVHLAILKPAKATATNALRKLVADAITEAGGEKALAAALAAVAISEGAKDGGLAKLRAELLEVTDRLAMFADGATGPLVIGLRAQRTSLEGHLERLLANMRQTATSAATALIVSAKGGDLEAIQSLGLASVTALGSDKLSTALTQAPNKALQPIADAIQAAYTK